MSSDVASFNSELYLFLITCITIVGIHNTILNFVYFQLSHSNGQEYAKIYYFTFEMDCACAKNQVFKFEL